jgi:hypothetical protein
MRQEAGEGQNSLRPESGTAVDVLRAYAKDRYKRAWTAGGAAGFARGAHHGAARAESERVQTNKDV